MLILYPANLINSLIRSALKLFSKFFRFHEIFCRKDHIICESRQFTPSFSIWVSFIFSFFFCCDQHLIFLFICLTFYFLTGVQTINNVIVLGEMQRDSTIHIHVSILPQTPSHPACHITLSRVLCLYSRSLLVIHFKYSSVHMSIPNSLTIPSPQQP